MLIKDLMKVFGICSLCGGVGTAARIVTEYGIEKGINRVDKHIQKNKRIKRQKEARIKRGKEIYGDHVQVVECEYEILEVA